MNLKSSLLSRLVLSACLVMLIGAISSCNKKTESEEETYVPESSMAVTNFSLKSKKGTKVQLDSVFFSIDLKKGVIFNADSLPVGTDITKLVPVISYASTASAVTLTQSGGIQEGEIDYKENPNDTVDFSGKVVLTITAEDTRYSRSYDIKVNVHKVEPDSLVWDQLAVTPMPSRLDSPEAQKTVKHNDTSYTLIKESDGSYTLAVATDLLKGEWEKKIPTLDFVPNVRTLCATSDCLYILDTMGYLHTSADGLTWENKGCKWTNIIGAYGKMMLGIRNEEGSCVHTCWPFDAGYDGTPVADDFPIEGYSNLVEFSNRWTTLPIAFMAGGRCADGSLSNQTWGFDGDHWAVLCEGMFPALEGTTIVPYVVYRKTSSSLVQTEFSVWMMMCGADADGKGNRMIYLSYDNGVNWYKAEEQMQLPDHFPDLVNLDGIVVEWPKNASISDNWSKMSARPLSGMARIKYDVKDYEVYWDCPYIYIFGGEIIESRILNNEIWRGVLNRLTFMPQF